MKDLLYFKLKNCPYCHEADRYLDELRASNPEYAAIPIKVIDEGEQRELADKYDYWYVPCFFADGVKLHEGASTKEKIRAVLDKCR
jgi:glutaredoxin